MSVTIGGRGRAATRPGRLYKLISIEASADRGEPPPRLVRMHGRLRVVTDEPVARVELPHKNIPKFGTITNTLASGETEAVAPVSPHATPPS